MYLNILKKDLKRKKTMNVILLIFVMLSAMFLASSVNNIIAVTSGLDFFFEESNMADYYVVAFDKGNDDMVNELNSLDSVTDCRKEQMIFGLSDCLEIKGEYIDTNSSPLFMPIDNAQINYYNQSNEKITEVEKGKAYISGAFASQNDLQIGDKINIILGERKVEVEYIGRVKDALFGSDFTAITRFIINNEDYEYLKDGEESKEQTGNILYIDTTDVSELRGVVGEYPGIAFHSDEASIKNSYIMSMIIAGLLLIVSVFLIITSFVVLKHTIGFTIAEEFREIGVMKAIGIKNRSIRSLYLIKYFAITIIGSAIGFGLSIPFSNLLLQSVTASMYIKSENDILVAILCSLAVVFITLFFCWTSTSRIKKLTAIDAVRNGATGERFRKKSILHLSKSKLGSTTFLAANDIVSAPKKYSIITIVFTILILLVMILANTANTMKSEKLLVLAGITESDVYINAMETVEKVDLSINTPEKWKEIEDNIEKTLAENDMPGKVFTESGYNIPVIAENEKNIVLFEHCSETKASDYVYGDGVAPENANEVALSYVISEQLGAGIGDKITLVVNGEEKECMVTALYQNVINMGVACRLHEDFDVSSFESSVKMFTQINFDDEVTKKECTERVEKLKEIYGIDDVYDREGYAEVVTNIADTLIAVKNMVLAIVLIIVILIAVLMERSFISAEKAEIALMKAIGFSNKSIIWHHTLRFAMVAAIASLAAAVLCLPVTKLAIDPVMSMMGAVNGIGYKIVPFEIFVLYPAILVAVTIISAFFTSIYTNTIKSSDASNIE